MNIPLEDPRDEKTAQRMVQQDKASDLFTARQVVLASKAKEKGKK